MPEIEYESKACAVLEQAVASFVNNKDYDVLLALERQGVSLVHGLAVAAYGGKHEQAEWFLARGVAPNSRVLRYAIAKGKQMTARILPYVKLGSEHADSAAGAMQPELLDKIIDGGVLPTARAYMFIGQYGGGRNMEATIEVLMKRGEPWRVGTRALLYTMHLINAQQMGHVLSVAPATFNREKLLARALRAGTEAVAQEVAQYGFGTKVTARVAIRAVGEKLKHLQDRNLEGTIGRMVQMHRDTKSEPLPDKAVNRVLSYLVRSYISSFHGDERDRGVRQARFLQAVQEVLSLGDPDHRFEILAKASLDFLIDRVESEEAEYLTRHQASWPVAFEAFRRFKGQFEALLVEETNKAAAELFVADDSPTFGGP